MKNTIFILLIAFFSAVFFSGCGGGGTNPVTSSTSADELFLVVSSPVYDGQIYTQNSLTVSGQTVPGAQVTVNSISVTVDSSGNFSTGVQIDSNPETINVVALKDSDSYQVQRNVYFDDISVCKIIFINSDSRSGYNRVYAYDPDIPSSERIVYDDLPGYSHSYPSLNPDANKVAFVRENTTGSQNIYTVDCDGASSLQQVTSTSGVHYRSISWSNSGSYLAYSSDAAGNYDIYTVSAAGGIQNQVTSHSAIDDSPSWVGADGYLVFNSFRSTGGGAGIIEYSNLWKIQLSSPFALSLLFDSALSGVSGCASGQTDCSSLQPDINEDGMIVMQFDAPCGTSGGGQEPPLSSCSNIYYMDISGTTPAAATTGSHNYIIPNWNVAGDAVVFTEILSEDANIIYMGFSGVSPDPPYDTAINGLQSDH